MSVVELIIFGAGGLRELVVDKANSKQRNSERLKISSKSQDFHQILFRDGMKTPLHHSLLQKYGT